MVDYSGWPVFRGAMCCSLRIVVDMEKPPESLRLLELYKVDLLSPEERDARRFLGVTIPIDWNEYQVWSLISLLRVKLEQGKGEAWFRFHAQALVEVATRYPIDVIMLAFSKGTNLHKRVHDLSLFIDKRGLR